MTNSEFFDSARSALISSLNELIKLAKEDNYEDILDILISLLAGVSIITVIKNNGNLKECIDNTTVKYWRLLEYILTSGRSTQKI